MLPYCFQKVKDLVFSEHILDTMWADKTTTLHSMVIILNAKEIN